MDRSSERVEKFLTESFFAQLPNMVERKLRFEKHSIIPAHHFSNALSETKESFVWGQYYGSITVAQATAEGIAKFICERSQLEERFFTDRHRGANQSERIQELKTKGIISAACAGAFEAIRGTDRNDFHHLNRAIVTELSILEQRAEECLRSLFTIESELFECPLGPGGTLNPKFPKFWNIGPDGSMPVFIQGSVWEY